MLNNLAWLYHQANDERGLALAQRAHELAPASPEIMDTYGWLMFNTGKTEQGLSLLEKAASLAPHNPDILFHVASAMYRSGEVDQARSRLNSILQTYQTFSLRKDAEALLVELDDH